MSPKGSSEDLVTEGWHHWEKQGLMEEAVWLVASLSSLCLRHCQVKSAAASTNYSPDKMFFPKATGPSNYRQKLLKQEARVVFSTVDGKRAQKLTRQFRVKRPQRKLTSFFLG